MRDAPKMNIDEQRLCGFIKTTIVSSVDTGFCTKATNVSSCDTSCYKNNQCQLVRHQLLQKQPMLARAISVVTKTTNVSPGHLILKSVLQWCFCGVPNLHQNIDVYLLIVFSRLVFAKDNYCHRSSVITVFCKTLDLH